MVLSDKSHTSKSVLAAMPFLAARALTGDSITAGPVRSSSGSESESGGSRTMGGRAAAAAPRPRRSGAMAGV
jgi:hypothetical protein